jgi:hypothetical protein
VRVVKWCSRRSDGRDDDPTRTSINDVRTIQVAYVIEVLALETFYIVFI